jgi:heterodisulfide reductase subunit C
MQFVDKSGSVKCDQSFWEQVKDVSRVNLDRCYQCLTCTLGCPMAPYMDYRPNEIIRMIQLGLRDEVLGCSTIWICASCEACVTRCPNDVNIPHLMDCLHQMTLREGIKPKVPQVPKFHDAFLDPIKWWGRQNEAAMSIDYLLRSKEFLSRKTLGVSIPLTIGMMTKRKIKFLPPKAGGGKAKVKQLFKETKARK